MTAVPAAASRPPLAACSRVQFALAVDDTRLRMDGQSADVPPVFFSNATADFTSRNA